jgi:cysteine-rich repeat protein
MDNTTGSAPIRETDPGVIAYLQVRDTPMTPQDVAASLAAICDAVSCGDGVIAGSEACDDGNATAGDGCSAGCAVEERWQSSGAPSTCAPRESGTACAPDGDSCTDDVCDAAGTCGVRTCGTPSTTTTTTTQPEGCGRGPAASFDSIICRIDALLARVRSESGLGSFRPKAAKNLEKARARTVDAQALDSRKKALKRLQQAAKEFESLAERRALKARLEADGWAGNVRGVTHGNAWSVYCEDPEGNGVELVLDSAWVAHGGAKRYKRPCLRFRPSRSLRPNPLKAVLLAAAGLMLAGCAARRDPVPAAPAFRFPNDAFAFANDTVYEYDVDAPPGAPAWRRRDPVPPFSLRCGNMVRGARQFHLHARFAPEQPRPDEATVARLAAAVLARDPRAVRPDGDLIVLPGYPDLRTLSAAHEAVLKTALGGTWRSHLQRGNWRMIFPFPPEQQRAEAERLAGAVRRGEAPILHVVRFPALTLNHMVLLYAIDETPAELRFQAYDPNDAAAPIVVRWDRGGRTFVYPRTVYFGGGPVKAYGIYDGLLS